jgi:hypothetical protein
MHLDKKGILLLCIITIYVNKLFISLRVSTFSEIYDPDFFNYYEPVAQNFPSIYSTNKGELAELSAKITPIFPIFLYLLQNRSIAFFVSTFMSFIILFLVYLISTKLLSNFWVLVPALLLTIEPSFYAASLNLAPETLYSLFLVLGVFFAVFQPFTNQKINLYLFSFFIGFSILIRPIALILILALIFLGVVNLLRHTDSKYIGPIFLLGLPSLLWSIRNYFSFGFFGPSSITSHNLLWYEGVPALANSEGTTFEESTATEFARKTSLLGAESSVLENFNYNNARGLELIRENPVGFLITHINGFPKFIFGIFKSKFVVILNQVYKIDNELFIGIVYFYLLSIVVIIWLLFIFGFNIIFTRNKHSAILIALIVGATLIPASGQVAYARFRSPIVPFICIVSAVGLSKLLHNNSKFLKNLARTSINKKA